VPYPARIAAARRDTSLLRLRRLSLWIAGGAAGASLSLGIALAHALPGHAAGSGQHAGATSGHSKPGSSRRSGTTSGSASNRHHHGHLSAPHQAPAPSSAPPVVSSGAS
jgi:hypothetical protein